jgi:hypothetical protein
MLLLRLLCVARREIDADMLHNALTVSNIHLSLVHLFFINPFHNPITLCNANIYRDDYNKGKMPIPETRGVEEGSTKRNIQRKVSVMNKVTLASMDEPIVHDVLCDGPIQHERHS